MLASLQDAYEQNRQELGVVARRLDHAKPESPQGLLSEPTVRKLLAECVVKMGGRCHVNVLAMHIQNNWPLCAIRPGLHPNELECSKIVLKILQNEGSFVRDADDCRWNLVKPKFEQPLLATVLEYFDHNEEGTISSVADYVNMHWRNESCLLHEEIHGLVALSLLFDPIIQYDSSTVEKSFRKKPCSQSGKRCTCDASRAFGPKRRKGGKMNCRTCGLLLRESEADTKYTEAESPWIRCDDCHEWVVATDDNIDDISIYDDSNPNHLDYFCPACRLKRAKSNMCESELSTPAPSVQRKRKAVALLRLDSVEKTLRQQETRVLLNSDASVDKSVKRELEERFWEDVANFKKVLIDAPGQDLDYDDGTLVCQFTNYVEQKRLKFHAQLGALYSIQRKNI